MKYLCLLFSLCILFLSVSGCTQKYDLNLNTDFPICDSLPDGNGQNCKVVILLGQSNASGASRTEYLQKNVTAEQYKRYCQGYDNVLINYCVDDHSNTSAGSFTKVGLSCGCTDGFFGAEVGMAEKLSEAFENETVFILKYSMSGYSLNHHWLRNGKRGDIYKACISFLNTYLSYLESKNYNVCVGAICWMQGEADCTEEKANAYLENQRKLVSYLRTDLKAYQDPMGIYFIDAGISDSPNWAPEYPLINAAKEIFSKDSPLNRYFSTIDHGLTTLNEPFDEPDTAHYDSMSEIKLGHLFAEQIIKIYS